MLFDWQTAYTDSRSFETPLPQSNTVRILNSKIFIFRGYADEMLFRFSYSSFIFSFVIDETMINIIV